MRCSIIIILLLIALIVVSLALVLAFSIGLGWLLTLFLPFTLFEGSLLALIASAIIGYIWYRLFISVPPFMPGPYDFEEEEDEDDSKFYEEIPPSRFYQKNTDKTWEAWFRYQIANGIYVEFQDAPARVAPMGDKQLQELAVRLADIAVSMLKDKTARAKRLRITTTTLKKQMSKMGQRPYDDDILKLATSAINEEVDYYYDELIQIIQNKTWNQPTDMFGTR